jgi:enterochelin esterase-like enzyme
VNRRALLALAALVWVGFGVYGTLTYGEAYLTYRGFPPPKDPPGVTPGRLLYERTYSPALRRRQPFLVYIPPGYAAAAARGHRFPVLYLLHGAPGGPAQFIDVAGAGVALDTGVYRHRLRPFLLVMPEGSDGTFRKQHEWANTPHGNYESWVLDVVHTVDRRFPTIHNRRGRAIGGASEGAYAAINIALHHLKTFSIAESWSGYSVEDRTGVFAHVPETLIRRNSPAYYVPLLARQLHRYPLHAYIYSGKRDHSLAEQRAFAQELAAAGGRVRFSEYRGGHDWQLWRDRTPRMLLYASHWLGRHR